MLGFAIGESSDSFLSALDSGLNTSTLDRPETLLPNRLREIVSRLSMDGRSLATEGVAGLEELLVRKRKTPYWWTRSAIAWPKAHRS